MAESIAHGTILEINTGSWLTVANVSAISGPDLAQPQFDATRLTDQLMRFFNGTPDGGNVTLDLFYDKVHPTHKALLAMLRDTTPTSCRISWAGSATERWDFTANLAGFVPGAPEGSMLTAQVTLKVTETLTLPDA